MTQRYAPQIVNEEERLASESQEDRTYLEERRIEGPAETAKEETSMA